MELQVVQIVPTVLATLNAVDPKQFDAEFPNVETSLHLEGWCVEIHILLTRGTLPALKRVREFARRFGRHCTVERFIQRGENPLQTITVKFPHRDPRRRH